MYDFYVGLDLGQRADYTALTIISDPIFVPSDALVWARTAKNELTQVNGWVSPSALLNPHPRSGTLSDSAVLELNRLQRYELNTPYPAIVADVKSLMMRAPFLGRSALLVDATGVGRPVVDMLRVAGLEPIPITITGGQTTNPADGGGFNVPKRDLAMAIQVLLQNRRLKIGGNLPLIEILRAELAAFEVKITSTVDTYEAWRKENAHDDCVLSVAIACWYREYLAQQIKPGFVYSYASGGHRDGYEKHAKRRGR